jgi:hypothetical protein
MTVTPDVSSYVSLPCAHTAHVCQGRERAVQPGGYYLRIHRVPELCLSCAWWLYGPRGVVPRPIVGGVMHREGREFLTPWEYDAEQVRHGHRSQLSM